jgi:hypothetical protein
MEYLERYLLQIGRHLNKKDREDTINELRDLLMENYENYQDPSLNAEETMIQVIKNFGAPIDVASKYNSNEPLISKEYTPLFYLILRIISITLPGALVLANTIEYFTNTEETSVMNFLLDTAYMIPSIIQAVVMALAFLLLTFIILSKYVQPKFEFTEHEFNPKTLPPIPVDALKAPMWESVIGIVGAVVFLYLFNLQPGLIAIYFEGNRIQLLNENFEQILPFFNISVFISLGLYVFYLYKRRKNFTTATIEFIQGIFVGVIMIVLAQRDIFSQILIDGYDLSFIPTMFRIILWVGGIASIIGNIVTYIKVLLRKDDKK